jgi:molybdenum cofactor biosynthesis protein B
MGVEEHRAHGPTRVRCLLVTVTDTRTEATDRSGQLAKGLVEAAGHEVVGYRIVRDEPAEVAALVGAVAAQAGADVVILNGGTGIARRDSTYEAVAGLIEKRLDGFGELFRMLSFQEIGPAAMASRASAGVVGGTLLFSLPGSTGAVRLALERLILPELGHLVGELRK